MKKYITLGFIAFFASTSFIFADDHGQPEYFNFQVNLCKLNKGSSIDKYSDSVNDYIEWGAGPRAAQSLILGAKAHAILNGNPSVNIDDVKKMVYPVLRHRVIPSYSADAEGISTDEILEKLVHG